MSTTRLSRSIPFWVLVAGSVVAIAGGAYLLITKLAVMASTLTDGSATGVEVYAGQTWAVIGGILVGAGLVGLALALTLAALRAVVAPRAIEVEAVEVISAPAWEDEVVETVPASRAEARTAAAPVTAAAPATAAADPEVAFAAEEPDATSPTDAETPRA